MTVRHLIRNVLLLGVAAVTPVVTAACERSGESYRAAAALTGGDPRRGRSIMSKYGCDSCHTIPGIRGANALVGPPLDRIGARMYLAGRLPNTPENMLLWIRTPQQVDPKNAMPDTGVTNEDARDIAAYLYTLR
jgi:cytochrome c2